MAKRKASGETTVDLAQYKFDPEMRLPHRAAHFLDWLASRYPGHWVRANFVVKAINGYKHQPLERSDEVEVFRARMSTVKKGLGGVYGRTLITQRSVGMRASIDEADRLRNALPGKMKVLRGAKDRVMEEAQAIDLRKIPNTPENKPYKEWFAKDVQKVLDFIGTDDFDKRCLPPVSTEP
jgi:hypothetical protein